MKWTEELEIKLTQYRQEGLTFNEIAKKLNTTRSSVKHKYRRLKQKENLDRYHHPVEKIDQVRRFLQDRKLVILETNAGWGNLTKEYLNYGEVIALEIDRERVAALNQITDDSLHTIQCDSFSEVHRFVWERTCFDVVDLDPYGYPSRFFPHIFYLIKDGYLFITFPKLGVQQINKITIAHLRVFWGITLSDSGCYLEKILQKMNDYALGCKRSLEVIDVLELDRVYRIACRVRKESMCKLVGLAIGN